MPRPTTRALALLWLLLGSAPPASAADGTRLIMDFTSPIAERRWSGPNDLVTEGRSAGRLTVTQRQTGVFSGFIAARRNSPAPAIRTQPDAYALDALDGLALRVLGDGRPYQLRAITSTRFEHVAYASEFATEPGTWTVVKLPFRAFEARYKGRRLEGMPPLDPRRIQAFGLAVAGGGDGPFRLEIDWIAAYRGRFEGGDAATPELSAGQVPAEPEPVPDSVALFAVADLDEAEAVVGRIDGVTGSRIGTLDKPKAPPGALRELTLDERLGNASTRQVLEVHFDPRRMDIPSLIRALRARNMFEAVVLPPDRELPTWVVLHGSERVTSEGELDPLPGKRSLRNKHPELYYLDLDEAQALELNAWAFFGGHQPDILSDAQEHRLIQLKARVNVDRPEKLDPDRARSGEALEAYRGRLEAWLRSDVENPALASQ